MESSSSTLLSNIDACPPTYMDLYMYDDSGWNSSIKRLMVQGIVERDHHCGIVSEQFEFNGDQYRFNIMVRSIMPDCVRRGNGSLSSAGAPYWHGIGPDVHIELQIFSDGRWAWPVNGEGQFVDFLPDKKSGLFVYYSVTRVDRHETAYARKFHKWEIELIW